VVHIKNVGDVTLRRYYKGTDMVIENIDDTLIDLVVDQSWYYDFGCDDIRFVSGQRWQQQPNE